MAKRKTTAVPSAPTASPSPMSAGAATTFAPSAGAPSRRPMGQTNPSGQVQSSGGNGSSRRPTQEEIARRAFAIWEAKGRPHGQDAANWAQAERELNGSR